jgi:hypothetical protein
MRRFVVKFEGVIVLEAEDAESAVTEGAQLVGKLNRRIWSNPDAGAGAPRYWIAIQGNSVRVAQDQEALLKHLAEDERTLVPFLHAGESLHTVAASEMERRRHDGDPSDGETPAGKGD